MKPDLRSLRRVAAPPGFVARVLRATGLVDRFARYDSAAGPVYVAWTTQGISAVQRAAGDAAFEAAYRARFARDVEPGEPNVDVRAVLAGARAPGDLAFDLRGRSPFETAVLRKALEIPRGQVRPYAWVARELGNPRAVRAVGTALAKNPVPLLIPCHRVVRTDGSLGEYALGADSKRVVLAAEGVDADAVRAMSRLGVWA